MMSHTTWTTLQFVKDKNNILTFNQWSATRYLKNFTGFTEVYSMVCIDEGFRITQPATTNWNYRRCTLSDIEPNTTYDIMLKVYADYKWGIYVRTGSTNLQSIYIEPNDSIQTITLTVTTLSEVTNSFIQFMNNIANSILEVYEISVTPQ